MFLEENDDINTGLKEDYPVYQYGYGKGYNEKNSNFGVGIAVGIMVTLSVVMLAFVIIAGSLVKKGYIHIGTNGEIYVQDTSVTDSEGIGSDVEAKLNALDSLMDMFYFDDVDDEVAKSNIYKAYLNTYGDKYTVYYTPDEYKSLLESTSGTFYGVGAACQKKEDGTILVVEAYEDAPAYKAGIRNGDCVSKVDGVDIRQMDLSIAVALIKGEEGTQVQLEVIRNGQTLNYTVTREKIKIKTVKYSILDNNIGYISISQFEEVTMTQFKQAVDELTASNVAGIVIDIRNNPGGVLSTVVSMLDYILPDGLIVYTEDKNESKKEYLGSDGHEVNIPIAVLVNGNSASASEIFAGAIQDYGKGVIIGTQTFGKGIVQTIRPLTDGSAVKFTIAKYYTPKGQDIHGKGVTPDRIVEADKNSASDTQLDSAIEYIESQRK